MSNVPDSSLWKSNNPQNGDTVDQSAWDQNTKIFQAAINDNQSQINAIKAGQATLLVATGTAYPANPSVGQLFYRTDTGNLMIYSGSTNGWVIADPTNASSLVVGGTTYTGSTSDTATTTALRDSGGNLTAKEFISTIPTGTAPFTVSSTTEVANLNAAQVGGYSASQSATANTVAVRDANGNVASAYPFASNQNPNLLFNPSWRLGSSGWTNTSSNGFSIFFGGYGEGTYLSNATSQTSGVQVDNSANKIPASANTTFTMSGEMFASSITAGGIFLQWFAFTSGGTSISGGQVSATNGTGWTKYSLTFTTPANTAYIQIACGISTNTTTTGTMGWRKIKVEAGSIATTFSDDNTLNTVQYGSVVVPLKVAHFESLAACFYAQPSGFTATASPTSQYQLTTAWEYVAANWQNIQGFILEVRGNAIQAGTTGYFQLYDNNTSATVGPQLSVGTAGTMVRSTLISPSTFVDGHVYSLNMWNGTSGDQIEIYAASLKAVY